MSISNDLRVIRWLPAFNKNSFLIKLLKIDYIWRIYSYIFTNDLIRLIWLFQRYLQKLINNFREVLALRVLDSAQNFKILIIYSLLKIKFNYLVLRFLIIWIFTCFYLFFNVFAYCLVKIAQSLHLLNSIFINFLLEFF